MSINRISSWLRMLGIQLLLVGTAMAQEPYLRGVDDLKLFEPSDFSLYGNYKQVNEGWWGSIEGVMWSISDPESALVGNPGVAPFTVFSGASQTVNSGNLTFAPNGGGPGDPLYTGFPSLPNPGFFGPGVLVNSPLQSSSSNTSWIKSSPQSGTRYEFGYIEENVGWMMSFLQVNPTVQNNVQSGAAINFANSPIGFIRGSGIRNGANVTFDQDIDGDGVYGRSGRDWGTNGVPGTPLDGIPDPEPAVNFPVVLSPAQPGPPPIPAVIANNFAISPPIPTDYDDVVSLPTVFGALATSQKNWMWGTEAMGVYRLKDTKRFRNVELFGGVRYLSLRDQYDALGLGGTLSGSFWDTYAKNNMVGPQVGARWTGGYNRFLFVTEGRFMAAANFQNVRQNGAIFVDNSNASALNVPAAQHFSSADNAVEFAPVGELRANLVYRVFRKVSLTAGWTGLGGTGVTRSSNRIQYVLPTMGITDTNRVQNFFVTGANIGVEINR